MSSPPATNTLTNLPPGSWPKIRTSGSNWERLFTACSNHSALSIPFFRPFCLPQPRKRYSVWDVRGTAIRVDLHGVVYRQERLFQRQRLCFRGSKGNLLQKRGGTAPP